MSKPLSSTLYISPANVDSFELEQSSMTTRLIGSSLLSDGLASCSRSLRCSTSTNVRRVVPTHAVRNRRCFSSTLTSAGPSTFSNQSKLPRLPVPDLEKTLSAYLKSLQPVVAQNVSSPIRPVETELTHAV